MKSSSAGGHLLDGALRLFLAEALLPLAGLVTSAVLTRRLGASGYGRFALASMLVITIQWVLSSLLGRATIKTVGESDDWQPAASAMLALTIGAVLLATLVRQHAAGHEAEARGLTHEAVRGVFLLAPFAAVTLGAREDVVRLVFGAAFGPSAPLLVPLVLASLALFVVSVTTAALTAGGRLRLTAALTLPMPFRAILGYVVAVPRAGVLGAAWVTASVAFAGCLAALVAAGHVLGAPAGRATLARVALVSVAGWLAASAIPGTGLLVLPRLGVVFLGAAAALLALGELPHDERRRLLGALRSAA